MRPLITCLLAASISFSISAFAQERIVNGDFAGMSSGEIPPKPWMVPSTVKNESGVTVSLEPLPDASDGKLWVHILDDDDTVPATFLQNFDPTSKGRLTLKLHFVKVGTAFGIYLGAPKVSAPETRVIDFKVLSNGVLSTGRAGDREKVDFRFEAGKTYDLVIAFERKGPKVAYQVSLADGEMLAESETQTDVEVAGLRIATDSKDKSTDVYVTDISLVAEE